MRYTEYKQLSPGARDVIDELVHASGTTKIHGGIHALVNGRRVDMTAFAEGVDRLVVATRLGVVRRLGATMHFAQVRNADDVEQYIKYHPAAPFKAAWQDMLMDDEQYDMGYTKEEYIDEAYKHL